MNPLYLNIYKSLTTASFISFLISFFSNGNVLYGATISGYVTLILAIMMILLIMINSIYKDNTKTALTIFSSGGPFILLLGVIGFILYLNISYHELISTGHISQTYYTFNSVAIILFITELYIIGDDFFKDPLHVNGLIKNTSYLLGVFAMICAYTLYIVLKYYSTDGFTYNL